VNLAAVKFPTIEEIVEWPTWVGEGIFAFNKIGMINVIAVVATAALFLFAGRELIPRGFQVVAESAVDFVREGVIMQTIGPDGIRYLPYLLSLFFFIFIGNLFEVIPVFNMPANARMANPAFLALLTLVFFVAVGVKHQGFFHYFGGALFPPGVPKPLYVLVAPIELLSTFVVRPFSLAVRLFANLLAGHILLVTFAVLSITLWQASPLALAWPFAFGMLVVMVAFEIMVAFLQAYIFIILAAVYLGGALHPEH
jgi:F-type H+-transporting ATPase subunit a